MLFLLFGVSAVQSVPTFQHDDPVTGRSLTCNQCPPGTYMAAYCTATTQTKCLPCKSQHFTEVWNYLPKCLYCYNFCSENQEVETECSATTNRVCRCKEGFYMINDFCMRHSECGVGHGVKTKGIYGGERWFLVLLREFCHRFASITWCKILLNLAGSFLQRMCIIMRENQCSCLQK